jgi:hypothetical protein
MKHGSLILVMWMEFQNFTSYFLIAIEGFKRLEQPMSSLKTLIFYDMCTHLFYIFFTNLYALKTLLEKLCICDFLTIVGWLLLD